MIFLFSISSLYKSLVFIFEKNILHVIKYIFRNLQFLKSQNIPVILLPSLWLLLKLQLSKTFVFIFNHFCIWTFDNQLSEKRTLKISCHKHEN